MLLIPLFLLCASLATAQSRPSVKFRATFAPNATGLTRANTVSTDLSAWLLGKTYMIRNPATIAINETGRREINAFLQLSAADALALKTYIESRLATWRADAGSVDLHFHHCPADGQFKDWEGCERDPRAAFQRIIQ